MKKYKSWEEWLDEIGKRESGGNYGAVNKYGYLGKYQMGEGALADTGYYKGRSKGNLQEWQGQFTGKDNVYSKDDYLKNHRAQDNAMQENVKKQWNYAKAFGYDKSVGSKINGIEVTPSGLLAGMHLIGSGGVGNYLKNHGQKKVVDGFNTDVEEYIKKFGDYDVSELIDPNYYAPKFGSSKEDVVNRVLNQGANVISGVANQGEISTPIPSDVINNSPIPTPLSMEEWMKRLKRHRMGLE